MMKRKKMMKMMTRTLMMIKISDDDCEQCGISMYIYGTMEYIYDLYDTINYDNVYRGDDIYEEERQYV